MSITPVNRAASSQAALAVLSEYVTRIREGTAAADGQLNQREAQVAAVKNVSEVAPAASKLRADQIVPGLSDQPKLRTTAAETERTSAASASTARSDSEAAEGGALDMHL